MVHNKRTKTSRLRGSHTHGWGAKKKHRGAGHRGGRGNAGLGKKGDARKTLIWKDPKHLGKYGFIPRPQDDVRTINISHLQTMLPVLIRKGCAESRAGKSHVDLDKAGYGKLLGSGKPTMQLDVTVSQASASAIGKIEAAGGKVTLTRKAAPEKVQQSKKAE